MMEPAFSFPHKDAMDGYLYAILGWGLGGFLNGLAGFGGALVALPFVAAGNDMALAVPSCTLMVLALSVQMAWSCRRTLAPAGLGPVLAGAVPGVGAGMLLLRCASDSALRLGLGLFLIAYGLAGPWLRRLRRGQPGPAWAALAGFCSTSLGTAYGINGPPLAMYLALRGGTQSETKSALGVFFIVSGLLMIAGQAVLGLYTPQAAMLFATALPAAVIGGWAGLRLAARCSDAAFHVWLHLMLLLLGANLVRVALA
ncbi:sulfite exporter TauE/SafE family protein [Humidesulfovibrio idahonensis]